MFTFSRRCPRLVREAFNLSFSVGDFLVEPTSDPVCDVALKRLHGRPEEAVDCGHVEQLVVADITPNLADRDFCVSNAGNLFGLSS